MATLQEVEAAFLRAHQAGDTNAAAALAGEVRRLRSAPKAAQPALDPSAGGGTLRPFGIDTGIQTPEWLDRGLAGAGKAFADLGRGAGQVVGLVSRDDIAEQRKLDAPLMKTPEGAFGNIAGNVAMLAPTAMIPGANTYTGAATIGALTGLLQPSTSTGETLSNVALGGAAGAGGQALANKLSSLATMRSTQLTQGQGSAAQGGQNLGMRLTPGKASGSKALQRFEAAMESNPMTSAGFDAFKETNQKVLNRSAAKAIGENADELSTPVLARAEARIGAVFDAVKDKTPVALDPVQVGGKLRQIAQETDGMLNNNADIAANGLWKQLDNFVNNQGGATREQLRNLSSNLGKKARAEMTGANGDRALGDALFKAQEVVEDAIQGTLTKAQQQAYAEARNQYRNLMMLTAKTNVVNPSSGNVSGRGLATTLMQKDRGGFTMGRNSSDMYDAARFVQAFPEIVGDSGTATRSMGAADWLAGIPGNLLARAYLSRPVSAAAGAGAGAAGIAGQLGAPVANRLAVPAAITAANPLAQWLQQ